MLNNTCENTLTVKGKRQHDTDIFTHATHDININGMLVTIGPENWVYNTNGAANTHFTTEINAPLQWLQRTSKKNPEIEFTLKYYAGYVDHGDTLIMQAGVRKYPSTNIFVKLFTKMKPKPRPKKFRKNGRSNRDSDSSGASQFWGGVADMINAFD